MQEKQYKLRYRTGSKKATEERSLDGRIDSLASRFERLDTKSSALQEKLERLVGAHATVANLAAALEVRVDSLSGKDAELDQLVASVNDQIREMGARIQDLGSSEEETAQIRDQIEALRSSAESNRSKFESMEQRLAALAEQSTSIGENTEEVGLRIAELIDHGKVLDSRTDDNRERVDGLSEELAATREELERLGSSVGALEDAMKRDTALKAMDERFTRIEAALNDADNRRAVQLDGINDSLLYQSERQGRLEADAKSTEEAVGDAKILLHKTGEKLLETRKNLRAHQVNIDSARSGLRVLAWSGVVAAAVLAALSIAGYLLQDSKQQMLRESLEKSLDRAEHRVDPGPEWDIQRTEDLEQDVRDLQSEIRELRHLVAESAPLQTPGQYPVSDQTSGEDAVEQPQTAEPKMDSTPLFPKVEPETEPSPEANAVEAMRGADQPNSVDEPEQLADDEPLPEPQAVKPEKPSELLSSQQEHQPELPSEANATEEVWRAAQQERHFTIQLMGGWSLSPLTKYAEEHGIGKNSAALETTRNGKPWFVLFNGSFASWAAAGKALKQLPPSMLSYKPWVRRLPASGRIAPLSTINKQL